MRTAETSPYQIKWVIIDNYARHIWKYQEKAVEKLGFMVIHQPGEKFGIAVKHYGNSEAVHADTQNIKEAWKILNKKGSGVGAIITDKQFGIIDTNNIKSAILVSTIKQRTDFSAIL